MATLDGCWAKAGQRGKAARAAPPAKAVSTRRRVTSPLPDSGGGAPASARFIARALSSARQIKSPRMPIPPFLERPRQHNRIRREGHNLGWLSRLAHCPYALLEQPGVIQEDRSSW